MYFKKKFSLLLTTIFCTNYILANHPLLEKANDGPRWFKTSTIIDCRSIRENSFIPSGKIGLGVWIIDFNNLNVAIYSGHHSKRPMDIFEYKIYESNNLRGKIETPNIGDLFEDEDAIYFNLGTETEFKLYKSSMILESTVHNNRKCRYL